MTEATATSAPALELRGITRRFGAVLALDDVSFTVSKGSIHALLGENGAGKTTLMRVAFGLLQPEAGQILIDGRSIQFHSPSDAISAGLGMVHQQFSLVPALSVAENVALGGKGAYRFHEVASHIEEIAARTGLRLEPAAPVSTLNSADRQKLEIIRALAHNAKLLILDEPTAVLTASDVSELFTQLKSFASQGGSVVLITHKLHDALAHSDEITVLRRGRLIQTSPTNSSTTESLAASMLGSDVRVDSEETARATHREMQPVITLAGIRVRDHRGAVTIERGNAEIRSGEIVGVAALEGAASGLLRIMAGRRPVEAGDVVLPQHVGFVPENRQDEAIISTFSLTENIALRDAGKRKGVLDWAEMRNAAASVIDRFDVRAAGTQATMSDLSGGNQQRFILGRELDGNPEALVLENPTQGLDVSAAASIHSRIRAVRDKGTAVVFYSSDLDELAELADRVLVVESRSITSVEADRDRIGEILLATSSSHQG
ncbi:MAG TPA: ATP-binding cassette domain-containing protein [Gemmatimonadaceae bacterium]|nr:ATP-binding cassette domain-containing protein [Gemmatimonadaceae bacterium]